MSNITTCQYIGKDQDPLKHWPLKTCGCKTVFGKAYCEEHLDVVYQKGTSLRKRKKEQQRAEAVWNLESELNTVLQELEQEGFL